jgi:epsin
VADLFSFDDDDDQPVASAPAPAVPAAAVPASSAPIDAFGDDFDDFQGAPPAAPPVSVAKAAPVKSAPAPVGAASFDLFGSATSSGDTALAATKSSLSTSSAALTPSAVSPSASSPLAQPARPPAATNTTFNFDDLWASSSGKSSTAGKQKMSMAEMAKNQSASALFGANSAATLPHAPAAQQQKKQDIFDLL